MGMYCGVYAAGPAEVKRIQSDPKALGQMLAAAPSMSLEKAWHGLHYLLTGSAWEGEEPLNFLLAGGETLGDADEEDGPPRLLKPDEVRQLDDALQRISDDDLWSRFDAEQMEADEIYPGIWDEDEADLREEYLMYFGQLKSLVHQARDKGQGLVVSIG
jgi:hypothetical protein